MLVAAHQRSVAIFCCNPVAASKTLQVTITMADEEVVLDLTLSDGDDDDDGAPSAPPAAVKSEGCCPHSPAAARRIRAPPRFNNDEDAPKVTIVNGKGFWKSWTRSFKTTLLKLLDLIDNAVDGTTAGAHEEGDGGAPSDFVGRVHVYPDVYKQSITNRRGERLTSTTGLCIRNNSSRPIVPLSEALVVHNTTKAEAGEIGENGVGLKQSCAALCDLSFVLVKNGSDDLELGIVAKALQREEGPYLPAFQFSNAKGQGHASLKEQMTSLFSQPNHEDVAQCVARYGADVSGGDASLAAGIDGLCRRFGNMCEDESDHVFEVVLNRIRHGGEEGLPRRAMDAQQKITVKQLIEDLKREIPKTYLHIGMLEFIVGDEMLTFNYWQERLVDLSKFSVTVGKTISWKQNFELR